jgi:hypothetical protein
MTRISGITAATLDHSHVSKPGGQLYWSSAELEFGALIAAAPVHETIAPLLSNAPPDQLGAVGLLLDFRATDRSTL